MRRGMWILAVLLMVGGLELATEGVSLFLARIQAGFAALGAGVEFHATPGRFLSGVGFLVAGAGLAALLAWSDRAQARVSVVGSACPQCGAETRRVKRKEWQRLLSALLGERLTRRRCETCHWTGLSLRH
ncbi:MAG: hypothetical protein RH859_07830 [Longimicrobiales bacterium]